MKLCTEKLFLFLSEQLLSSKTNKEVEEEEEEDEEQEAVKATAAYLASCLMTGSGELEARGSLVYNYKYNNYLAT